MYKPIEQHERQQIRVEDLQPSQLDASARL
jgi:hypothetical protein